MASKIQCNLNSDPAGEFYYPDNPNSPDAFADGEPSDANDARLDASDATFVDVYHTDGFTNSGNAIVVSHILIHCHNSPIYDECQTQSA